METTLSKSARGRSVRYVPPTRVLEIPAAEARITNGLSERVPIIYAAGDRSLIDLPGVAIVGSRKASEEGRRRAAKLARELAANGIVVISGLAEGIDHAAHSGAIAAGGKTIAVIGTPLDHAYPAKHAPLQEQIYREHLLLSPFQIGTPTHRGSFPERNRVMARIARATVIIEAGDTSGTLHQAVECEKSGRSLFIAQSVLDNPALEWPKRFRHIPLTDTTDVIAQIL
jgi:DNA processing protein